MQIQKFGFNTTTPALQNVKREALSQKPCSVAFQGLGAAPKKSFISAVKTFFTRIESPIKFKFKSHDELLESLNASGKKYNITKRRFGGENVDLYHSNGNLAQRYIFRRDKTLGCISKYNAEGKQIKDTEIKRNGSLYSIERLNPKTGNVDEYIDFGFSEIEFVKINPSTNKPTQVLEYTKKGKWLEYDPVSGEKTAEYKEYPSRKKV